MMRNFILPLWGGLLGVSWALFSLFDIESALRPLFVFTAVFGSGGLGAYWVFYITKHYKNFDFKIKFKFKW